jgi:hypothetical protein
VKSCGKDKDAQIFDVTVSDGRISMVMRPTYDSVGPNCKVGAKEILEGTLSADGAIRGTRRWGDKRFEQRCAAGGLPLNTWNYTDRPMTGRVVEQGSMIEIRYDQWVQGRNYPMTLQFRRR